MTAITQDENTDSDSYREFMKKIAKSDLDDVLVLKRETVREVFTEKRIELLDQIKAESVESVRDLARKVDRNPSAVHRDLKLLYENDLIEFEQDGNTRKPTMKHENVISGPIV